MQITVRHEAVQLVTQDEEKRGLLNLLVTFGVIEPKDIRK